MKSKSQETVKNCRQTLDACYLKNGRGQGLPMQPQKHSYLVELPQRIPHGIWMSLFLAVRRLFVPMLLKTSIDNLGYNLNRGCIYKKKFQTML